MKWKMLKIETIIKNSRIELENIKKFATKEEIARLINSIFNKSLDGTNYKDCVYGQMTDSCYNNRATVLIENCANSIRVTGVLDLSDHSFRGFVQHQKRNNDNTYHSQLEVLLYNDLDKGIELIKEVFSEYFKEETI